MENEPLVSDIEKYHAWLEKKRAMEVWQEIGAKFYKGLRSDVPFDGTVFQWLADNYYPPRERKK